ncbi:MAG: DNA helicase RecQ [Firmicutes bacterium]|nr:DNA helicase RecQ [Bacillota bacterium]
MNPAEILQQYFGYDEFREGQSELIGALVHGRDVLGIMPTGAGKSLCYQVPAMLLPGVTLVISPLISLMRDQVQALVANGIAAAFINSSLPPSQWPRVLANARGGQYKIIYIAPERLLAPSMLELVQSLPIPLIAVDEAHCISQWGQDFRPSYLDIPQFVEGLPKRPVLAAFTATATPRVREDILQKLGLKKPLTLVTGFDRPNLYFEVQQPKDKYAALVQYLKENDGSGIVYCSTRKEVESVTAKLIADNYSAARYHAGLSDGERSRAQDNFLYDRIKVIVATNAFGMGIDKSNVRFVIHYNMPQNVESYYQEAGRAGRDGLPGDCVLFYARKDINTALFLINQSENQDEIIRNKQLLNHMERYCETDGCLRRFMLRYFGEPATDDCGNCGNCNGNFVETDVTIDAQKVLSHILRLNRAGKRFMFTHTANILLGKSDDFTDLSTFGIMKGTPRHYIRRLITRLTALGYVYDDGYLSVTPQANEVLFKNVRVTMRGNKPEVSAQAKGAKKPAAEPGYEISEDLFAKLKELRLEIAREEQVPAFVIFSDATLVDMCRKYPRTEDEMLSVSGVGQVKLKRYGERFLTLFRAPEPPLQSREKIPELTADLFARQVEIEDNPLPISRVADNINVVLIRYGKPKVSGMKLNNLMIEAGYLESKDGVKLPTPNGRALGITTVERASERGNYIQCLFSAAAQRVCVALVSSAT